MKKRILCFVLAIVLCVGLLPMTALAEGKDNFKQVQTYKDGTFSDVNQFDWFSENVASAYELNLMVGRSKTRFAPQENVTVAEAFAIAARLHSIYYTGTAEFKEGKPWYQVYADYCKQNGIADAAKYDMTALATRAQFAMIIADALPYSALEEINHVLKNMIPDVKYADDFGDAVYKLYRAGVLIGSDAQGTFNPHSNIRRAEVAAIATRMANPALRQYIDLGWKVDRNGFYPLIQYPPYFPVTPATVTIADILPADFPTSADGNAPENAWVTDENAKAYIYNGMLTFRKGTPDAIPLTSELVENGNNYEFTDTLQGLNFLFVMSDGVLTAITLSNSTHNSGTYMKMITIADVLATVEGGFPSSSNALTPPENAWTAGDGKYVHFYTDKATLVFNEPGGTTNGISASNGVTKSGSDYEYSTSEVTTTFHMTGGKLTSIEYYHDKDHKFDGTYVKMNTIADVLATVEGGFPSSSNALTPPENAWTAGDGEYVHFYTDKATLVFNEPGGTTNGISTSNGVTKSGSDYKYSEIGVRITFHMTGGKLTSIEYMGIIPTYDGIYAPQKTVADMLATVEGGFPSSSIPSTPPAGAWTDGQGKTIYANTEGTTVYFKNDLGQSTSMSTTEKVTVSGSDYVYETAYVTITFHMTQGKLTSIEYRGVFPGYDGIYEPKKTVLDMLVTVKDGFPMGMADGWKNDNYSCYYTGTQMLYFSYTKNDFIVSCNTTSVSPALGGNYTCRTANGATATFVMKDKVLSSIVVSGETGDYAAINGEYKPLPTMQVASILATADDFPTEVSKAWHRDDDGDADCYLDTASNSLHIEKMAFNLLTDKVATLTMAKQSGTNWVCKTENNADITFNMSGSKLVSITVANEPTAYVVLNGEYKQTGGHHG